MPGTTTDEPDSRVDPRREHLSLSKAQRSTLTWQTANASGVNGACVEVAPAGDAVAVRHSKDPDGPVLMYTAAEWAAFLDGAKKGEFDHLAR